MPFQVKNANYNALRKLNLRERLAAASDSSMGQVLIQMLSPSQISDLFPKYWLERNPNISGFLKAIPSSMSAAKQREYERQIQNTASGSAAGANYDAGGYRREWQKEMDAERQRSQVTKRFQAPLPQLSPEQKSAFEALKAGDIGVNDERVKFLKNISDADLSRAGLTRVKGDTGERFHYQAPQVSEEQVKGNMSTGWKGGSFKSSDYASVLRQAGFKEQDIPLMTAVGIRESNHNVFAANDKNPSRERSYGLFQVNLNAHPFGSPELNYAGIHNMDDLRDPIKNAKVAHYLYYKTPTGIRHWGAYTDGGYKQYLNEAQAGYAASSGRGFTGGDPLTQNYTPQQLEAKKRELLSQIEAGRITELAQITQPGLRAAAQELNINTPSDMKQVKAQMAQSSGGFYHSTASTVSATRQECADLSKAFNPNVGPAGGWKVERNDSGIRPGVVVATSRYNDGSGGKHAQGYHTGVAMSGVRPDGTFLLLEQANGMKPRVSVMNVGNYNYNGRHPEIQGNFWAPIKGHENEQSVEALKVGYQIAPSDTERASIQSSLSGGVSDSNVITSNSNRVERTIAGYGNSEQMAQSAGVGLSEKAQAERKAVVQGSVSFEGGGSYHFGSGRPDDSNFPSTPLGSSPVGGLNPHHVPGGVGYEMPAFNNKLDPKVGRTRNGMVIHSSGHDDLKQLYSHGCISIAKSEFPAFQQEMEDFKRAHGGKAYINVMPDGRVTVTAQPAYSEDGNPITPMSTDQAIKEIQTNQPQVVQSATQVAAGDIKPLSSVTQPEGPVNAAGAATPTTTAPAAAVEEPKPAEPTKPAAPSAERYKVDISKFTSAIRQTEDFKRQTNMGLFSIANAIPDSRIINGFNDDPRVIAAGVHLDEQGIMHFSKGMTPEAKEAMSTFDTKSFMTKIEEKKKEDVAATKVKAMAEGGPVPVNTEQITAYPIGGLRGDNAVVVNAHQKPLFTMNTNEDVLMDPDNNRAQVIPNTKGTNVGPMPKENMTSGIMEDFNSTIQEIRKDFASLKADKATTPNMSPASPAITENGWLGRLSDTANDPFKTPSIRRVAYRAGGMETGEPYSGFHHSRGNNS